MNDLFFPMFLVIVTSVFKESFVLGMKYIKRLPGEA